MLTFFAFAWCNLFEMTYPQCQRSQGASLVPYLITTQFLTSLQLGFVSTPTYQSICVVYSTLKFLSLPLSSAHHPNGRLGILAFPSQAALTDPYLSPSMAPPELLAKFPPTHITSGGLDPLLDDGVHFAYRLQKESRPVHLPIYSHEPCSLCTYAGGAPHL